MKTASLLSAHAAYEYASLADAARELKRLDRRLAEFENEMAASVARVPEERRESAVNLVHYLALRQHDLRELQVHLAQLGLSSLGRSESCVQSSVLAVSRRAHEALALRGDANALGELAHIEEVGAGAVTAQTARGLLHRHTRELLGGRPEGRHIYIMVTAPSARDADRAWMSKTLRAGMNVLRINCAHEGPDEWLRVVKALEEARRAAAIECPIIMDLAGPKIRTGPIAGARHVATWKPERDDVGMVTTATPVALRRASAPLNEAVGPVLLVDERGFASIRVGDRLRFLDARGKKRSLEVSKIGPEEIVALATQRAYVLDRAQAQIVRNGAVTGELLLVVGGGETAAIDVRTGDELVLTTRQANGRPPQRDRAGRVERPGVVACTLPAALEHLEVGHRVLFDEGRIVTTVTAVDEKRRDFVLQVARTQKPRVKLRAEKGINLPDTETTIPALTEEDLRALEFVAKHADAVSLSFVRRPEDLLRLHTELDRLGRSGIGVVLKIETKAGFESLPRLLLEGLRRPPLGVMIARGDLAVEVGFERLAELQEEILWLCEASRVPAIWATQVLDTLARTGVPSRAEVTDAAASVAAECVMLNKGAFVDEAVRVLSDILRRMEKHYDKKRSLFRKLRVSAFAAP